MDTLIIALIVTLWIGLVLPAVILPFLPRNPEASAQRTARVPARVSFLRPTSSGDTNGGQAVA